MSVFNNYKKYSPENNLDNLNELDKSTFKNYVNRNNRDVLNNYQTAIQNENPSNNIVQRLEDGEDLYDALLNKNHKETEADIKRQRAADFWGNVAKVFGQAMASKAGVRQFDKIENRTPYYNDQLLKLKQNHNNAKLQQTLLERKYEMDRKNTEHENQQKRNTYAFQKGVDYHYGSLLEGDKTNNRIKVDNNTHANDLEKQGVIHGYNIERDNNAHKNNMGEISARGKIQQNIAKGNNQSQERIAAMRNEDEPTESLLVNRNGEKEVVRFSKNQKGAIASLYNRLRELVKLKENKDLDELKLQAGENTDHVNKALATLGQYMQYYPELTAELDDILEPEDFSQYQVNPKTQNKTTTKKPRLK